MGSATRAGAKAGNGRGGTRTDRAKGTGGTLAVGAMRGATIDEITAGRLAAHGPRPHAQLAATRGTRATS